MSHTPAGAATYQLMHYIQGSQTGRFCKFDWGSTEENMLRYGRPTPPDYNLSNVVSRVILHYSDNDWLNSPIDVARLYAKLPNAKRSHVSDRKYAFFFFHMLTEFLN